jgi:hypothetical protein
LIVTTLKYSQEPNQRDLERDHGEVVWVENEEGNSEELLECIVVRKRRDSLARDTVYQLAMRDDGSLFADGRYLPSHRLFDKASNTQPVKSRWDSRLEDDSIFKEPSVSGQRTRKPQRRHDASDATVTAQSTSYNEQPHFDDKRVRGHGRDELDASASKDMNSVEARAEPHPKTSLISYDAGNAFVNLRDQVARVMEEQPEVIELDLAWDVVAILRGQYASGEVAPGCLSKTVVYSGTPTMCYATTVGHYAEEIWPDVGSSVLACFEHALSNLDNGRTAPSERFKGPDGQFQGIRVMINLGGETTSVKIKCVRSFNKHPQDTMSSVSNLYHQTE